MSILLDALKKSEEQRQLGRTPDIHASSDLPSGRRETTAANWLPVSLVVAAAVLIGFFSWQQFHVPERSLEEPVTDVSGAVSGQPAVAERRAGSSGKPGEKPATTPATRSPLATYTAPPAEQATDAAAESGRDDQRRELAQSFSGFQGPADEAGTEAGAEPGTQATEPPQEPASAPVERQEQAELDRARQTQAVSYWELPQNVRDGMPELRISVLVYADSPEDRFVLVNGRRMVEQDTLEGVLLDEIRRDGAVFRYRNYRFLVRN